MKRLCFLLLLLTFSVNAQGQSAEELIQQALTLERSQGDYSGAIALYKRVSETAGVERPLAGKALIQMAQAYENLGRSEAALTYQRVLADFGDMPDLVAEARDGYARTAEPVQPGEPVAYQAVLDVGEHFENWGSGMSPSGRFLAGYNYEPTGIRVLDTQRGTVNDLTLAADGYGEFPRFSPDESQIALGWHPGDRVTNLIVVDRASGEARELLSVSEYYKARDGLSIVRSSVHPLDWTQDGSAVVAFVGVSETAGSTSDDAWLMEFLVVPLAGGAPTLLGGLDGAGRYAWEKACLSTDDRYLFVDFYRRIAGRQNPYYIRRFDLASGESRVWRDAPTGMTRLVGCANEPEGVLYMDGAIGAPAIRIAAALDETPEDDPLITRLPDDVSLALGAENGDISAFMTGAVPRGISLFDVDEDTGRLTGTAETMAVGYVRGLSWSPSGASLAYFDTDRKDNRIGVFDPETGTESDFIVGPGMTGLNWDSEGAIAYSLDTPDRGNDWVQTFDVGLLDLEAGSGSVSLRAKDFSEAGLNVLRHLSGKQWIAWSQETRCLVLVDASTMEQNSARCFEDFAGVLLFPSPDGTRYAVRGGTGGGTEHTEFEIGVLSVDGWEYTPVRRFTRDGHRVRRIAWLSAEELLLARGDHSWNYTRAERLSLATGEVSPAYPSLFRQFHVRRLEVRPGGDMIAVWGSPKTTVEGRKPVTIIRALAEARK